MIRLDNKYMRLAAIIVPILLAVLCLVQMLRINNQAFMPVPKACNFSGEYSYDGKNWYPYDENSEISALEGDLVVKGHLDSDVPEGSMLNFYCNHIGVSIYVNDELLYIDTPAEIKNYGIDLMASMCGKRWEQLLCPMISTEDEIEIHFINYHQHENKYAYKEALSSLFLGPQDNSILEVYLKSYIEPFQMTGYALLIVAVLLLGACLSAVFFKSSMINRLFKMGITTLFVGGYMLFDVMMIYFADELLVVKTYGSQLCLMLGVYFIGMLVCDSLKENYKKIAEIAIGISAIINIMIIVLATIGKVLLYDTIFYWKIVQYIIGVVLMVVSVLEIKRDKKSRTELILFICLYIALMMDMAGVGYGMYYSGICFKAVYVIILILFLLHGANQAVLDHQASIKNKKLKVELEQSRIFCIIH